MLTYTIHELENALSMLDQELKMIGDIKITVRAIGGFAMMYYGLRDNGFTIDIDSLTPDYDDSVKIIIKKIGKELGIDEDWLNTDCAKLDGFLGDLSNDIQWVKAKYSFECIDMKIADIKGLIQSKAKAVNDGGLVPRLTDKIDLLCGLRSVGINCVMDLDSNIDYSFIKNIYPICYEYLCSINKWNK